MSEAEGSATFVLVVQLTVGMVRDWITQARFTLELARILTDIVTFGRGTT